jgi:hypothetical protein
MLNQSPRQSPNSGGSLQNERLFSLTEEPFCFVRCPILKVGLLKKLFLVRVAGF